MNSSSHMDPSFVDNIVQEVKSQGIFDEFRRDSMADVDTKPAYQNLHQRVESEVEKFLQKQNWSPDMNKIQLREKLRKHVTEAGFLDNGVEQIVDQVVNPKIGTIYKPKIEDIAYKFLGIKKPDKCDIIRPPSPQEEAPLPPLPPLPPMPPNGSDLRVDISNHSTGLEQVSPDSDKVTLQSEPKEVVSECESDKVMDEDDSPPFEPLEKCDEITKINATEEKQAPAANRALPNSASTSCANKSITEKFDTEVQNSILSVNTTDLNAYKEVSASFDALASQDSQLSKVSSDSNLSNLNENDSIQNATIEKEAVNISEEAQMPKFNENSSDVTGDQVPSDLHFDINKDEIKFEGTERNSIMLTASKENAEDHIECDIINNTDNYLEPKKEIIGSAHFHFPKLQIDLNLNMVAHDSSFGTSIDSDQFRNTKERNTAYKSTTDDKILTAITNSSSDMIAYSKRESSTHSSSLHKKERRHYYDKERRRSRSKGRRDRSRDRGRAKSRGRSRAKSRERSRARSRGRSRDKSGDKSIDRSKGKGRDKSQDKSRDKSQDKSRDKSRGRSRDRYRERSKNKKTHKSRDKYRDRSKDKKRHRSKDREKHKSSKYSSSNSKYSKISSSSSKRASQKRSMSYSSSSSDKSEYDTKHRRTEFKKRRSSYKESSSSKSKTESKVRDDHNESKDKIRRRKSTDSEDENKYPTNRLTNVVSTLFNATSTPVGNQKGSSGNGNTTNTKEYSAKTALCDNKQFRNVVILNDLLQYTSSCVDIESKPQFKTNLNVHSTKCEEDVLYFEDQIDDFEERIRLIDNIVIDVSKISKECTNIQHNSQTDVLLPENINKEEEDAENQCQLNSTKARLVIDCIPVQYKTTSRRRIESELLASNKRLTLTGDDLEILKASPTPSETSVNSKENEGFDKNIDNTKITQPNRHNISQMKLSQQQRYNSEDLYKPRPLLSQKSRRRGINSI